MQLVPVRQQQGTQQTRKEKNSNRRKLMALIPETLMANLSLPDVLCLWSNESCPCNSIQPNGLTCNKSESAQQQLHSSNASDSKMACTHNWYAVTGAHLHIVHDDVFVPGPPQGAAVMTELEEAPLLWSLRGGLALHQTHTRQWVKPALFLTARVKQCMPNRVLARICCNMAPCKSALNLSNELW